MFLSKYFNSKSKRQNVKINTTPMWIISAYCKAEILGEWQSSQNKTSCTKPLQIL